ncbi:MULTISPECIES: chromosomal replication initiator protein DnaA [Caldisericum]|jgi:chromosomal replication initiator protein|uniref:Chromosomal replication initiator protein DnaA n=1 Tax=Caldisericum exile TaxID=693075 RepID=A0A2J6WF83_9BACT|nr:MAG: chromosomal replication initiator protein DnaA [Caldisericum exile]
MNTWEKVLEQLKEILSVPAFETFIRPVEFVSESDSEITLKAPSIFVKEMLETKYASLVNSTLKEVTGRNISLNILVEEKKPKTPPVIIVNNITLNKDYTFEEFVVGSGNRLSYAAAKAVASNPGKVYNPLYIYGKVGLGKTHLLHAIGHELIRNFKDIKIIYTTAEKFTNEVIFAIQNAQSNSDLIDRFHKKYRTTDVLLIDDIQFLVGKERTQEEFFHTFNALHEAGKQIVITSDVPPKELATLEERLRSRFEWGLITDIQPPDYETRIAILRKKAQKENITISDEVLAYIANNIFSNIRELEGALIRLVAKASLLNENITVEFAKNALSDIIKQTSEPITVDRIKKVVAEYFNVDVDSLSDKRRTQSIVLPRQIAMYLTREFTDLSLPQIGDAFGGRDHTTVMHAYAKIKEEVNKTETMRALVDEIINKLKG